jgi:hypothetical protein
MSDALGEGSLAAKQRLSQAIERGDVTPPGIADSDKPTG